MKRIKEQRKIYKYKIPFTHYTLIKLRLLLQNYI